jgi:preprotein translocase subunit YajC
MQWIALSIPMTAMFILGVWLIIWGRDQKRRAQARIDWAEEMREKHPWLRKAD